MSSHSRSQIPNHPLTPLHPRSCRPPRQIPLRRLPVDRWRPPHTRLRRRTLRPHILSRRPQAIKDAHIRQRKDSILAPDDRPCAEVVELADQIAGDVKAVAKRHLVDGHLIVDEAVDVVDKHVARRVVRAVGRGEEHPVRLAPLHARVERHAGLGAHGGVKGRLHLIGGGGEGAELQQDVLIEVEDGRVCRVVAILKRKVRFVWVRAQALVVEEVGVVAADVRVVRVAGEVAVGYQANCSFDGKVGLIGEGPGAIVGGELRGDVDAVGHEVISIALEQGGVLGRERSVASGACVSVNQHHQVASLFDWLIFFHLIIVTRSVRVSGSDIVNDEWLEHSISVE